MQETQETQVWSLGWEDPLEKNTATHSSIPAWRIPWTEEPGGLQSMGLQRVGQDWTDWAPTYTHSRDKMLLVPKGEKDLGRNTPQRKHGLSQEARDQDLSFILREMGSHWQVWRVYERRDVPAWVLGNTISRTSEGSKAQGTLFNILWQPGWEGSLGENGYLYTFGWVPSLFTYTHPPCCVLLPPWHLSPSVKLYSHVFLVYCLFPSLDCELHRLSDPGIQLLFP